MCVFLSVGGSCFAEGRCCCLGEEVSLGGIPVVWGVQWWLTQKST